MDTNEIEGGAKRPSLIDQLMAHAAMNIGFDIDISTDTSPRQNHTLAPLMARAVLEELEELLARHSIRRTPGSRDILIVLASQQMDRRMDEGVVYVILDDTGIVQRQPNAPHVSVLSDALEQFKGTGHIVSAPMSTQMTKEDRILAEQGKLPMASNMVRPLDILNLLKRANARRQPDR